MSAWPRSSNSRRVLVSGDLPHDDLAEVRAAPAAPVSGEAHQTTSWTSCCQFCSTYGPVPASWSVIQLCAHSSLLVICALSAFESRIKPAFFEAMALIKVVLWPSQIELDGVWVNDLDLLHWIGHEPAKDVGAGKAGEDGARDIVLDVVGGHAAASGVERDAMPQVKSPYRFVRIGLP